MEINEDFLRKAELKRKGRDLEKRNLIKAILFYEDLLTNELFLNDYYPYKCLVILYGKNKDYRRQYNIIKSFFTSNIYCSNRFRLFFKNNLYGLVDRKFTTKEEIDYLLNYYDENGLKNKEKSNFPVIIADRIMMNNKKPSPMPEKDYVWDQEYAEWKEIARGYRLEGNYQKSIETYEKMIYDGPYYSYKYFAALYSLYKKIGDYENAQRIVNEYLEWGYIKSDGGLSDFKKYKREIECLINGDSNLNKSKLIIISPKEEEYSDINLKNSDELINLEDDFNNKENIPEYFRVPEGNYFAELQEQLEEKETFNLNEEYGLITQLTDKYKVDIKKPLVFYEYDKNLSEEENLQRKYYLKRYADQLRNKKYFIEYIELLEKLKDNSYFKYDWYPYKHLNLYYDRTYKFNESLKNLKELFSREIWLNDYHYDFFCFSFKKLENKMKLDEKEILNCLDYYENHGALNKYNSDVPVVLADKIKNPNKDTITAYSDEVFENIQEEYGFKMFGLLFEIDRDYERAVQYYLDVINNGVILFEIYDRLIYCLDILDEYELLFEVLKHFYRNNEVDSKHKKNRKFLSKKLKIVNSNLGTTYKIKDLKE